MKCAKCNQEKDSTEFYANDKTCKECRKALVRANRAKKIDYYREYDKKRANDPKRVKARAEYIKTDAGKAASNKAKRKWAERNAIKYGASTIVGNAVRDGKLIKPEYCEDCGCKPERLHGHHDDYAKPLDVRWLCPQCHSNWHKENGPGLNAK
jgi:Zn finger protein HypA/HybF involved in hydrogenase expression